MRRRAFVSLSAVSLLAGCTADSNSQGDEPTTTPASPATTDRPVSTSDQVLTSFHGITGQTYPPDIEGNHHRRFEWSAVGYDWWYEIDISRSLGAYYRHRYGLSDNYDVYVSDPFGDDIIREMAEEFGGLQDEYDLTKRETVNLAVAFVQSMNYTEDEVTSGFNQYTYYPVETLIERGGDCEDSTILLAAILRQMGYDCVLLGLWDVEPEAHMALGVKGDDSVAGTYYEHAGKRYYYVETTGEGWQIGEMPEFGGETEAEIMEIEDHPTLVYEFDTNVQGGRAVDVNATVWNYGQRAGNQTYFNAWFEARSGDVYGAEDTQIGPIEYEERKAARVDVHPPADRDVRLVTAVTIDGSIHDLAKSGWREPG